MSYCSQQEYNNLNIPELPVGNGCLKTNNDGSISVYRSDKSFSEIREENLRILQNKFDEIRDSKVSKLDQHEKINCLISFMLENLEKSNLEFLDESNDVNSKKEMLEREKEFLENQERVLRSNENSELVAKYRKETSNKRNKALNTQFTIYVSMIVIFLIIEGIVFFV
jgi:hypothetical protein